MEKQKSNNSLIPIIILAVFVAFIGFISFSLFIQVTNVEGVVVLRDGNISQLSGDLNTTTNMLDGKKAELVIANADKAALTSQLTTANTAKDLMAGQLSGKTNELNEVSIKYADLNLLYTNLDGNFVLLKNDYNIAVTVVNDMNDSGRVLYNLFTPCYWASVCRNDSNDCRNEFGNIIDVNLTIDSKVTECISILETDKNIIEIFQ